MTFSVAYNPFSCSDAVYHLYILDEIFEKMLECAELIDPLELALSAKTLDNYEEFLNHDVQFLAKEFLLDFSRNIPKTTHMQVAYLDIPMKGVKLKPSVILASNP